jgi:hypothetical protein
VLTELYASGHKIEPRTARVFAEMLQINVTLRILCVGDEMLGDEVMSCDFFSSRTPQIN